MLAGAGTCLDQSHCVLGRVAGLVAITSIIRSKWVLIFFFHVCDRPYRVITLRARPTNAKTVGRARTHALTWITDSY
jgi:hypothetical protein